MCFESSINYHKSRKTIQLMAGTLIHKTKKNTYFGVMLSKKGQRYFFIVQANMERVKSTSIAIFRDTRHGQRTALKKKKHVSNYPSCQIVLRELFRI